MIQNALSSTHGSKDTECACFGELGLNDEAKASRFEPNLSLSIYRKWNFFVPVQYITNL